MTSTKPTPTTITQDKAFASAIFFSLFLFILEERQFGLIQTYYFLDLPTNQPLLRYSGLLVMILLFMVNLLFFWASFISKPSLKIIYFLLFTISTFIQYNFQSTFGRFITVNDVFIGTTSPPELWFEAFTLFFKWLGLIPIFIYLALLLLNKSAKPNSWKLLPTLTIAITLFSTILFFTGYKDNPAISLSHFFKTLTNAIWESSQIVRYERETIPFQATNSPTNNIIFIIDESVRGDHLSINGYERVTTPYLEQLAEQNYLVNYGIAVSSATCSIQSNNVLVMGLATLPDIERRTEQNPSIFQYAKAMGYTTYHFDAETDQLWNGLSVADLQYVDHRITRSDLGADMESDFRAATQIVELISQSTGNFILLNKFGTHYHYNSVYPPEQAVWTPVPPEKNYVNLVEVANSYDNAILFNVNGFFERLLANPAVLSNSIIVYTSDHGQTLSEGGVIVPHCGDTKNQAIVPLLIFSKSDLGLDNRFKASHFNIFATLLDLLQVPEGERLHSYPLSLFEAGPTDSVDRYFLGLTGGQENERMFNFDN